MTDNVNESKGDAGPEDWKPPLSKPPSPSPLPPPFLVPILSLSLWDVSDDLVANDLAASYYCTYAKMWVKVKNVYKLTITSAEKTALTSMLNTC